MKPRRDPRTSFFGSLLPYATPAGAVLLGARPLADRAFSLEVTGARSQGAISHPPPQRRLLRRAHALVDLDPVINVLPSLPLVPVFAALREPSDAAARRWRLTLDPPLPFLTGLDGA